MSLNREYYTFLGEILGVENKTPLRGKLWILNAIDRLIH